jgi:hypothetical protein
MKVLIRIFVFFIVLVVLGFLALYTYKKNRTAAYKQFFLEEACLAQSIFDKKGNLKLPDSPNITKDQVNVLVIDGGGAKGLYVLRVLEYLEEKTNKSISELYDVIGGTSVGSLLGATLSIPGEKGPKYTAKKLIPIFKKIGNNTLCPTFSHKVLSAFTRKSEAYPRASPLHGRHSFKRMSKSSDTLVKYDPNFPFYEGKIAGLAELPTMIVEGRNQLIRDYLDILSKKKLYAFDSLINIGIKEDNEWLLINPFDFSKRNLRKIDKFATKIIERNKDKLDKVVQELQKE